MKADYDKIYETLWNVDETHSILGPRKRLVLNMCAKIVEEIESVLEIGCGKGDFLNLINKRYNSAIGCDISKIALSERLDNTANVVLVDAKKLPFQKESFDLIIAIEVLEHIRNDLDVFNRWVKLLKCGGHMIISVPFNKKLWGPDDERIGHYRRYGLKDIQHLAKLSKLQIVDIKFSGFPFYITARFILNMMDRFRKEKHSAGMMIKHKANCNHTIAAILNLLIRIEFVFKKLPIGLSILVICKKI